MLLAILVCPDCRLQESLKSIWLPSLNMCQSPAQVLVASSRSVHFHGKASFYGMEAAVPGTVHSSMQRYIGLGD